MQSGIKPLPGRLIQPAHPLARGLVACWLMNEGSGNRTKDLCVSTPDTFSGGTLFVPGKFGPCLSFDGTGDFIRRASGLLATVPFTVVAWAKCPDPTAGHAIFWMGDSTIGDQYFGLYLSSSGYAAAAHRTNSGGQDIAIGTVVAADECGINWRACSSTIVSAMYIWTAEKERRIQVGIKIFQPPIGRPLDVSTIRRPP